MANVDLALTSLQKLYEKRSALDKQIVTAEKKLVSAAKTPATKAKKTTAKKTTARKTTAKKTTARKKTASKKAAKK